MLFALGRLAGRQLGFLLGEEVRQADQHSARYRHDQRGGQDLFQQGGVLFGLQLHGGPTDRLDRGIEASNAPQIDMMTVQGMSFEYFSIRSS